MNDYLNRNVTVIVRTVGERTERACLALLKDQISECNIIVIKETPFIEAVRQTFLAGLNANRKWTFVVDADVLLYKGVLSKIVSIGDNIDSSSFEIQGLIDDAFFMIKRPAGNHLYRTKLLKRAIHIIDEKVSDLRPESYIVNKMSEMGFPWIQTDIIVGSHDVNQYYKDIFRKCIVQAHKHKHLIPVIKPLWEKKKTTDFDFEVALMGLEYGKNIPSIRIDKTLFEKEISVALESRGIKEKELMGNDFSVHPVTVNTVGLQDMVFPKALWNKVHVKKRKQTDRERFSHRILKGVRSYLFNATTTVSDIVQNHPSDYYYNVWMKHLVFALELSASKKIPETVVEIGPGAKLGLGIAALLSGARKYYGFDIVRQGSEKENLTVLREVSEYYRQHKGVKSDQAYTDFTHLMDGGSFPSQYLTEQMINANLSKKRLRAIRKLISVDGVDQIDEIVLKYVVPWPDNYVELQDKVDFVISHAVMEHVDDISSAYNVFYQILKKDSLMSHQIDFRSHGLTEQWNGQWCVPSDVWNAICCGRNYAINRFPVSEHIAAIKKAGFTIERLIYRRAENHLKRENLSSEFICLSDDDLTCSGVFIQARK